jgi:hypothetical protein
MYQDRNQDPNQKEKNFKCFLVLLKPKVDEFHDLVMDSMFTIFLYKTTLEYLLFVHTYNKLQAMGDEGKRNNLSEDQMNALSLLHMPTLLLIHVYKLTCFHMRTHNLCYLPSINELLRIHSTHKPHTVTEETLNPYWVQLCQYIIRFNIKTHKTHHGIKKSYDDYKGRTLPEIMEECKRESVQVEEEYRRRDRLRPREGEGHRDDDDDGDSDDGDAVLHRAPHRVQTREREQVEHGLRSQLDRILTYPEEHVERNSGGDGILNPPDARLQGERIAPARKVGHLAPHEST